MKNKGALTVVIVLLVIVIGLLFTYFLFDYLDNQGSFEENSLGYEKVQEVVHPFEWGVKR